MKAAHKIRAKKGRSEPWDWSDRARGMIPESRERVKPPSLPPSRLPGPLAGAVAVDQLENVAHGQRCVIEVLCPRGAAQRDVVPARRDQQIDGGARSDHP